MLTKCGGEARNRGMLCLSVFPCKRGMKRYLAGMGTSSAILGCARCPIPKRLFCSLLYGQKVPRRAVSAGNEAIEEL